MQQLATALILLGLGSLLLPLIGIQFKVVTEFLKLVNVSEGALGLILIGIGLVVGVIPSRRGFVQGAWNDPRVRAARDSATPPIDDMFDHRGDALSEEAVRKIYPFYWEITLRLQRERYDAVAAAIAPRAAVSADDVVMFIFAAMGAISAKRQSEPPT